MDDCPVDRLVVMHGNIPEAHGMPHASCQFSVNYTCIGKSIECFSHR